MPWFTIGQARVRRASRVVSKDASAANYAALARAYAAVGQHGDVLRICSEGLELHPGSGELQRIARGARAEHHRARTIRLREELSISPRAALYRELCELLLEVGDAQGALETAQRWANKTQEPEAVYFCAAAHAEFFFDGRRAQDGMAAFRSAGECARALPRDKRPLRLQFEIARRCGAWEDARQALARLLELMPGNPLLEARFRRVLANCAHSKPLQRALVDVERCGRFLDDEMGKVEGLDRESLRPTLKRLASVPEVHVAFFLRGNTALVQGARGPTADRTARAVREVLQLSCASARRMALGRALEIRVEGSFGALTLKPGSLGTSAAWSSHPPRREVRALLDELSGGTSQEQAA